MFDFDLTMTSGALLCVANAWAFDVVFLKQLKTFVMNGHLAVIPE